MRQDALCARARLILLLLINNEEVQENAKKSSRRRRSGASHGRGRGWGTNWAQCTSRTQARRDNDNKKTQTRIQRRKWTRTKYAFSSDTRLLVGWIIECIHKLFQKLEQEQHAPIA